jgi:hypothetical protein
MSEEYRVTAREAVGPWVGDAGIEPATSAV